MIQPNKGNKHKTQCISIMKIMLIKKLEERVYLS